MLKRLLAQVSAGLAAINVCGCDVPLDDHGFSPVGKHPSFIRVEREWNTSKTGCSEEKKATTCWEKQFVGLSKTNDGRREEIIGSQLYVEEAHQPATWYYMAESTGSVNKWEFSQVWTKLGKKWTRIS